MPIDLIAIVKHTPVWVWVLLGFLIFRGVTALKTRSLTVQRLLIIPVLFLIWPMIAIYSDLQNPLIGLLSFCVGIIIGGLIGLRVWQGNGTYYSETKMFERKGSPITLLLIILAFSTKYILSVSLHLHPEYISNVRFSVVFGGLSGFWDGLFWGGVILLFEQMRKFEK